MGQKCSFSFYLLAIFFGLFVLFLYGPMSTIFILSFQGPQGELTFPMRGVGFYWFEILFQGQTKIGNLGTSFMRSLMLGLVVMFLTFAISVMAGLAFRRKFYGSQIIFYLTIASIIVPSILVSFGIGIAFNLLGLQTDLFSSALGAQLTWTIPFAFLIVIGVFNRFNPSYEEASRDLGANDFNTFWQIVFPIIGASLVGVALFAFVLSYDEYARTSLVVGENNTLPLEIFGMTTLDVSPVVYALGTFTTAFSFTIIAIALAAFQFLSRRQQQ